MILPQAPNAEPSFPLLASVQFLFAPSVIKARLNSTAAAFDSVTQAELLLSPAWTLETKPIAANF
jgi:hypothetical protein